MNRKIQRVTYNDFRGGMVQKNPVAFVDADPQLTLALNQLVKAENVALWPDGSVSQRSCFRKVATHAAGRAIVGMCLVPGTDSAVVIDTYISSGTKTDIKVLHVGYGTIPTSTWAAPASGVAIVMASSQPAMVAYNGKVYVGGWGAGGGIREVVVTAGSEAVGAGFGPTTPILMCIHNERLVAVNYATPNLIEMSLSGTPTDFTNGIAFAVGQCKNIVGIASLEGDLFIFTDSGIFLLTGNTKSDMQLTPIATPYQNGNYGTKGSFTPGYLDGFGPCVFYFDQALSPCAISRNGITKVLDGAFAKTNFDLANFINASFLSDSKQFLAFSTGTDKIYSFFGGAPYKSPSGTRWGLSEFTLPAEVTRGFPACSTSGFIAQASLPQNKPVFLIAYSSGMIYLYTQYGLDDVNDSGYSGDALDDYADTGYWEPQGIIQMRPEHGGMGTVKHWTRAIIKVNKKGAGLYTAYYKLGDPVTSTVTGITFPNALELSADIDKHAQNLSFGFNLFDSSVKSATQILKQCIIRSITLEFEVEG
jgi:hypothetical protein